ncbi:hypothetical protein [Frankia sp. ACN1ag]|uniref:hypothetical protein n=1 Tax=Frankia sp. ACN1ag TaxID=102891 RepID=UPI00128F63C5|nr:hypothetical protein [Frankia sp. ACN1ag]
MVLVGCPTSEIGRCRACGQVGSVAGPTAADGVVEAAAILRRFLALVDAGTLSAPAGLAERLYGSATALEAFCHSVGAEGDGGV